MPFGLIGPVDTQGSRNRLSAILTESHPSRSLNMRIIGAALLATTLVASNAFAASQSIAPLPAGKPAGVKEAASMGPNTFLVLLGAGIVIGGLALTLSSSGDGVTTPTTTSTSTA